MTGKEVREMKNEEIAIELKKLRTQLFDSRTQAVSEKIEDTSVFRKHRKDIARLLTEQRSRELKKA